MPQCIGQKGVNKMGKKVLLAGESWMMYTTHVKGFDAFYTSKYETGEKWLQSSTGRGWL